MTSLNINTEPEKKNHYALKINVLSVLGAISFLALGFFLSAFLAGFPGISRAIAGWTAFAIVFLVLIFFILESVFSRGYRIVFSLISGISAAIGLYFGGLSMPFWLLILLGLIVSIFVTMGRIAVVKGDQNSLKMSWGITKSGSSLLLTGLAIFFSICLGWSWQNNYQKGEFFSERAALKVLEGSSFMIRGIYPGFSWNMSLDDFAKIQAEKSAGKIFEKTAGKISSILPSSVSGIVDAQKKSIINQSATYFKEDLSKMVGFALSGKETLVSVFYRWLLGVFSNLSVNAKYAIFFGAAVLVFLVLNGISPIFGIIGRFLGYAVFQFLLAINFASIVYETRNKETAVLD